MPLRHIPTPPRTTSADIVSYLREFELHLADLAPEQVVMFIAARNAASYVESLDMPVASEPQRTGADSLAEEETTRSLPRTVYRGVERQTVLPADEMDVGFIGGLQDLPRLFPTQWLLEEMQPSLFCHKLAQRDLLVPIWRRPTSPSRDSHDDARLRDLVDDRALPTTTRQHAYVLLDISRSMNDRDRRGTVARGLALAFLRHGHRGRSQLNVRPFNAGVQPLSFGIGEAALGDLARRIISVPNTGQTRIQTALEAAARDVRRAGPCRRADIMLISDGLSRLTENPLAREKLHTFILREVSQPSNDADSLATLRAWSRSFTQLTQGEFARLLTPSRADLRAAAELLGQATERLRAGTSTLTPEALARLRRNTAALLAEWKRTRQQDKPGADEQRQLEALLDSLPDWPSLPEGTARAQHPAGKQKPLDLEAVVSPSVASAASCRGGYRAPSPRSQCPAATPRTSNVNASAFLAILLRPLRVVARWARRFLRL